MFIPLLCDIVVPRHATVKLVDAIDRQSVEDGLSVSLCTDNGRTTGPVRLLVALHDFKYASNLSNEAILDEWLENSYWLYFTSETYFEYEYPTDRSTMSRWRKNLPGAVVCY